jgi:hypothetical protein
MGSARATRTVSAPTQSLEECAPRIARVIPEDQRAYRRTFHFYRKKLLARDVGVGFSPVDTLLIKPDKPVAVV